MTNDAPKNRLIPGRVPIAQAHSSSTSITLAGRLISCRTQSGSSIGILEDESGSIELIFRVPPVTIKESDLIAVDGSYRGERFEVAEVRLLIASQCADHEGLPERRIMETRAAMLRSVRHFFEMRGFIEVETPALSLTPDQSPAIQVFETRYGDEWGRVADLYLPTSPEPYMKRLVCGGFERIYQICKFFRNGESGRLHNPEFTGVEWYEAYSDYRRAMTTTRDLILQVAAALGVNASLVSSHLPVLLNQEWLTCGFYNLIESRTGLKLGGLTERSTVRAVIEAAGYHTMPDDTLDDLLLRVFVHAVEPYLGYDAPTFVVDYPACMAAMAQPNRENPDVVERFELYISGVELCNGYTELGDPVEQRARFMEDRAKKYKDRDVPLDRLFLAALRHGMPPCSGNALGLDRLLMLLTGGDEIDDVRPFTLNSELTKLRRLSEESVG